MKKFNLEGHKFERLTATNQSKKIGIHTYWLCVCECGNSKFIRESSLIHGYSNSCGCLQRQIMSSVMKRHGMTNSREFNTWKSMIGRCNNIKDPAYKYYGGRGILVCSRWFESFENFYEDMGNRPEGKTIDRIDTNGNYEPSNCKWSTPKEQQTNRRITCQTK